MNQKMKLGVDLCLQDSILDGISFEELITTVRCNCKDVCAKNVQAEARKLLNHRIQTMNDLITGNIDAIIEIVLQNRPLKMSFYDGTLNKAVAKKRIAATDKPLAYTFGFEYRRPTTHRVPIDKERAYKIIDRDGRLDITEEDDCIHLNEFSDYDMW